MPLLWAKVSLGLMLQYKKTQRYRGRKKIFKTYEAIEQLANNHKLVFKAILNTEELNESWYIAVFIWAGKPFIRFFVVYPIDAPIRITDTICKEYEHLNLNRADLRAITPAGFAEAFFKANK